MSALVAAVVGGIAGALLTLLLVRGQPARAARPHLQPQPGDELLHALLDAIPNALNAKDEAGRWLFANRRAAQWVGSDPGAVAGRTCAQLFPDESHERVRREDEEVLRTGRAIAVEEEVRLRDGTTTRVLKHKSAATLADGRRVLLVSMLDVGAERDAARELERTRRYLDAVIDAIPQPLFVKDREHRYVTVNTAFCAVLGRTRDALIGCSDADFLLPEKAAEAWAEDRRAFASPTPMLFHGPGRSAATARRWYLRTKAAIRMEGAEYITCVSTDVTELKQAEQALERSRGRLQLVNAILAEVTSGQPVDAVLRNAVQTLWTAFPALRVCYSTIDHAGRVRVLHTRQPAGMDVLDEPEADLDESPDYLARLRRGELCQASLDQQRPGAMPPWLGPRAWTTLDLPLQHDRATLGLLSFDSQVPREWSVHEQETLRQVGEALQAALHAAQTDAQRRLAERETRSARELLDAVVQAVPVVVSVKDHQGRVVFVNEACGDVLGAPPAHFLGRADAEVYPPEQARSIVEQDAQARAAAGLLTFEEVLTPVRGGARWVVKRKRGVDLPDGTRGVVTTVYDVTEIKHSELELRHHRDHLQELVEARTAELRRAMEAAEHASRAKSEFLANMSHELRTPMHAVLSFAQLGVERCAAPGADVARLEQYFGRIHQSGARLLALLNDLLDLAKLESGRTHYEFAEHDLAALAAAAIQELLPLAGEAGVELRLAPGGPLPPVRCDPARLGQVLHNLLGNAIKFSPPRSRAWVELCTGAAAEHGVGGRVVLLRVLDEGVGVPAGEHESIFDKFTQSSRTRSKAGGTGLGLPICREIVQAHGGAIWAESRAPAGACFTVALPLQPAAAQPADMDSGAAKRAHIQEAG